MSRDKLSLDITWIKTGEDISEISLSDLLSSIHEKSDAIADAVEQLEALLRDIED
jgi:type I restriction enzyme M protein